VSLLINSTIQPRSLLLAVLIAIALVSIRVNAESGGKRVFIDAPATSASSANNAGIKGENNLLDCIV